MYFTVVLLGASFGGARSFNPPEARSAIAIAAGGHQVCGCESPQERRSAMNTQEVAKEFTDLCLAGKMDEAGRKFWSEDVVSIEAMPGDMARLQGRKAVEGKGKWWSENNELHGLKIDGPYVNGDEFTMTYEMEVTPKGQKRMTMKEIALYKVKNGKVVEEKFYYGGS
jgi:hypothetical protein